MIKGKIQKPDGFLSKNIVRFVLFDKNMPCLAPCLWLWPVPSTSLFDFYKIIIEEERKAMTLLIKHDLIGLYLFLLGALFPYFYCHPDPH
jgi:hypothetical protein